MLLAGEAQERERHADQIVQVDLRLQDAGDAAGGGEDRRQHLLRRRLAVRPGDGEDARRELVPPVRGEILQRSQRIRDDERGEIVALLELVRHVLDDCARGAGADDLAEEGVRVVVLTLERDEHRARLQLPRVGADGGERRETAATVHAGAGRAHHVGEPPGRRRR